MVERAALEHRDARTAERSDHAIGDLAALARAHEARQVFVFERHGSRDVAVDGGEACAHHQTDIEGSCADLRADDGRRFFAVVAHDIRSRPKIRPRPGMVCKPRHVINDR